MDHKSLNHWSKRAADWILNYHETLRGRPVRPRVKPGQIVTGIPDHAPESAQSPEAIFADFETLIPGAMTHWQHPRFFAYFPANASPASMLAEQLTNAIAAQAMIWQTAPVANDLEEKMIQWLRDALGLAPHFSGTIHDSATTATLSAVLTMRELTLDYKGLTEGLSAQPRLRIYASSQTHSSVDKAVRLAGIGQDNLVKVPTDPACSMDPAALDALIRSDLSAGHSPAGVVLCVGGTSIGAVDHVRECIAVAKSHGLTVHVDAAWAGSAMICEELRSLWDGVDAADSIVFNPHKWLGIQFDCAVQFLRDPAPQINTLGLRPEYLKTRGADEIINYNEWTVPLGRRFRALKIWFTLRAYGLEGLRTRIRNHITWSQEAEAAIAALPGCEITSPRVLSLFTFALKAGNEATAALLDRINNDGRIYLTQTLHEDQFVIRVQVGQFDCTRKDVMVIPEVVSEFLPE